MLGRLFKNNSPSQPPSQTCNSYEDAYSREILYGTHNYNQLKPYQFNNKLFRIIISQDGGNLQSKQVLFDTVSESSQYHHSQLELNDYMFGCGLPSNENQCSTKLHILPRLSNTNLILITRLFSINDFEGKLYQDWQPQPGLMYRNDSLNEVINSRFAIGLVIPLESDFINDVIFNNWQEILYFSFNLQKNLYKKLLLLINQNHNCIMNKRIQLTNHILQGDHEINLQFYKLIKLIHYNYNLPRLINANYLMKRDSTTNPMLISWVLEILNWLEFKDGKSSNGNYTFLSSLIALLMSLKHSLAFKPYYNSLAKSREITRILVMTGNPVVAKKLIFILNGFLPQKDDVEIEISPNMVKPMPIQKRQSETTPTSSFSKSIPSVKGWEIPNKATIVTDTSRIQTSTGEIPINSSSTSSSSMAYLSSSLNSSYSSTHSNYSLSKFGGSFMEKWKGQFNQTPTSTSLNNFDIESPSLTKRNSVHSLRTPSPAVEFEEYSWNNHQSSPQISRAQSMYDLYNLNVMNEEEQNQYPTTPSRTSMEIKRSKTSIYSPMVDDKCVKNVNEHNKETIRKKCKKIMEMKLGDLNNLKFDQYTIYKHKPLHASVAYSDEFRPEFIIQSCPINMKLEQQVLNTMKNDLSFYVKNSKSEEVTIRTVFISLRAREIKLLEMNSNRDNSNSYKLKSKKVYSQMKNLGNKEAIEKIDTILNDISQLFVNQQELYHDKQKFSSNGKDFYTNLTKLVYRLLE